MIAVHHLESSRSQRVLWFLEELELPYEIVLYARDPKTSLAPPALIAIHPLGKSPVITDEGVTVAESGAILEHLAERHGKGRFVPAAGTPEHQRYRYFMHYAEGSLMPFLLLKLVAGRIASAPAPFFVRPIARTISSRLSSSFVDPQLERHLAFLGSELRDRTWVAGNDLTLADFQMSYPLEAAVARGGEAVPQRLRDLVDAIHARPAYQRALAKGGTFEIL